MRLYLFTIFLLPLLDLFDVAFERYASRYDYHHSVFPPYRWFDFGYLTLRGDPYVKFWQLRLPSYEWTHFDYTNRWGWGQRVLWWTSKNGFHSELWEKLR